MYDPSLNKWTTVSPLHHARDGACCVSDGEHVYAIGGYNGSAYLTSVERYHVENNAWDIDGKLCYKPFEVKLVEK